MVFFRQFNGKLKKAEKTFIFDILPHVSSKTDLVVNSRYSPIDGIEIMKLCNMGKTKFYNIMSNLINLKIFSKVTIDNKICYKINHKYHSLKKTKVNIWRLSHAKYINSAEWHKKRALVLSRDNNQCQHCGSTEFLHVHHLSYKNFKDEPLEDLVTLCKYCHARVHNKPSGGE